MTELSILLIDDDEEIRLALRPALERSGFSVETAAGGYEALDMIADADFDVVVTDVMMDQGEGIETLIALQKSHPSLPVIGISAKPEYLKMLRQLGAAATLAKPFRIEELVEAIENTRK